MYENRLECSTELPQWKQLCWRKRGAGCPVEYYDDQPSRFPLDLEQWAVGATDVALVP